MKELSKKYKVSCTNKEEKNFNAFDECVGYIKNKVSDLTESLYHEDIIDKYAVEDILWWIEENIKAHKGYSHPDIPEEWEIIKI